MSKETSTSPGRILNIAAFVSAFFFGFTIILWVSTLWINPWDHLISLSSSFHISVCGRGLNSRLVFFNNDEYGPYRGSIISITDSNGNMHPPIDRKVGLGDVLGIYYRFFHWPDETLWTLMVSLWYPTIIFSMLPLLWCKKHLCLKK